MVVRRDGGLIPLAINQGDSLSESRKMRFTGILQSDSQAFDLGVFLFLFSASYKLFYVLVLTKFKLINRVRPLQQ